jgi:hypothetical protein
MEVKAAPIYNLKYYSAINIIIRMWADENNCRKKLWKNEQ